MRVVERIWEGDGGAESVARALLLPFETLYRGVVAVRGNLYDRGILASVRSPIPVISVGNLTVGGTGKTPIANWIASRLRDGGATPAIVLRGYGDDEVVVHRELTPGLLVIASKDRAEGIRRAAAEGATVAVLDDAFQHRSAARDADIAIVSADGWTGKTRLLPAGPWREPIESIGRASLAIISRKAATEEVAAEVGHRIEQVAPHVPQAVVRLRASTLISATDSGQRRDASVLSGRRILAVSAIGNPEAFAKQLRLLGAEVNPRAFPDHHAFSSEDVARIIDDSSGSDMVVCTLKDAVKLRLLWRASGPALWYVSQSLDVENGSAAIDELLVRFKTAN